MAGGLVGGGRCSTPEERREKFELDGVYRLAGCVVVIVFRRGTGDVEWYLCAGWVIVTEVGGWGVMGG